MKKTKKMQETAKDIFKKNPEYSKLYVNDKGEFFTSESFAQASVKNPKDLGEIKNEEVEQVEDQYKEDDVLVKRVQDAEKKASQEEELKKEAVIRAEAAEGKIDEAEKNAEASKKEANTASEAASEATKRAETAEARVKELEASAKKDPAKK